MRQPRLSVVPRVDAERLARLLAEVDEAPPAPPAARLASLAARLTEGAPAAVVPPPTPSPAVEPQATETVAESPPESAHDLLRRTLLEYGAVLKRYREDFDRLFQDQPGAAATQDATLRRLEQARRLLIQYPVAGQALFAALVAEGRRYAQTPEGQRQQAALAQSDLVRKGRAVFEAVSAGVLGEHEGPLPSAFLEAFLETTGRDGLEGLLGQTFGGMK